ncbi:MAG: Uma2 family endonuclease [Planctomycetaceae bacterium]
MSQATISNSEFPAVPVHRFSVDEYERLAEVGILNAEDRVELLEGLIVPKMVHNPLHARALELADQAIRPHLPHGWRLRIQLPIRTDDSEPEPDLAIVRGTLREQPLRHPVADEVGLIVEIADSSLRPDRVMKRRLYARAGIAHYWIVNLVDRRLEVHANPSGRSRAPKYRDVRLLDAGERAALILDGREIASIAVDDLLPDIAAEE